MGRGHLRVGSPPLTREPLFLLLVFHLVLGITPAHAGTTYRYLHTMRIRGDHPRSRGNHGIIDRIRGFFSGSPPLTREPPIPCVVPSMPSGITPAHAGTTRAMTKVNTTPQDHPRSRGNHPITITKQSKKMGSPPAHAGTTLCTLCMPQMGEDHPRSRGNHI